MTISTRSIPAIETLESRIAPASVLIFTDIDGDTVKITSSCGQLAGHATFSAQGAGQHLDVLDLTDDSFSHANVTFQVKRGAHGDGTADVGFINATGNDLGNVTVLGDLGRIVAGDGNASLPAIKSLRAYSLGASHAVAQSSGGTSGIASADTTAFQDSMKTLTDSVTGSLNSVVDAAGNLVAGNALSAEGQRLLGDLTSELHSLQTGTPGHFFSVSSGAVQSLGALIGDAGKLLALSPADLSALGTGLCQCLHDVSVQAGLLLGVQASGSAAPGLLGLPGLGLPDLGGILGGVLGKVGSLLDSTGIIGATIGTVPTATLTLLNATGSALTHLLSSAPADFASLPASLQHALLQSSDDLHAFLNGSSTLNAETVRELAALQSSVSSILGVGASDPTLLTTNVLSQLTTLSTSVTKLLSSSSTSSTSTPPSAPSCDLNGSLGSINIRGDLSSVFLNVHGDIGSATIGGSLVGGGEVGGGQIYASGNIKSVIVGGNVIGGGELNTGFIHSGGIMKSCLVKGSLLGGNGTNSAAIVAEGDLTTVSIRGDLGGRDGLFSGTVVDLNGGIGSFVVGGSVMGGHNAGAAAIAATDVIKTLNVRGGLLGDVGHEVKLTAMGDKTVNGLLDPAFGKITIGGSVRHAEILAGFDLQGTGLNGSAQIGSIVVGHDWTASSVSAGIVDSHGDGYGNTDDSVIAQHHQGIFSRIASITIRGHISGTSASNDHYGFTAGSIGCFKMGSTSIPMKANTLEMTTIPTGTTGDVTIHEVAVVG